MNDFSFSVCLLQGGSRHTTAEVRACAQASRLYGVSTRTRTNTSQSSTSRMDRPSRAPVCLQASGICTAVSASYPPRPAGIFETFLSFCGLQNSMAYAALLVLTKEYQQPQTRNVTTLSQKFLTVNRYPSYPDELRQGVADSGVRRENLFITNKVRLRCVFFGLRV